MTRSNATPPATPPTSNLETDQPSSRRVLSLFDCICIIVGTIIGAGIFRVPSVVAANVPNVYWMFGVWVFGGMIALIGALCFAELTTTYPDRGGDYGYLKRAFGRRIGFAFSWAAFWVIRPTNIGALAVIFGGFAVKVFPGWLSPFGFAVLVVAVISGTNLLGVAFGKATQNVLTVAKLLGMLLIVIAAIGSGPGPGPDADVQMDRSGNSVSLQSPTGQDVDPVESAEQALDAASSQPNAETPAAVEPTWEWFWLSMVFVMFAFGGWSDIAFVASEVHEPRKNLLRALVIGIGIVLVVYLMVIVSLVWGVGFDRMAELGSRWESASAVLIQEKMGAWGGRFFAVLVCVSCLGGINGMMFTSPRIYWATAADYPVLHWMTGGRGGWRAIVLQAMVTFVFIVIFGRSKDGFDYIVLSSAPYFWLFLGLTVAALVVCRIRFKGQFIGYRVPLYPLLPLIFVGACGFMVYRSWDYMIYKELLTPAIGIAIWVLLGGVLGLVLKRPPKC